MRTIVAIFALIGLASCTTQTGSRVTVTSQALERRITPEGAHALVLADTDRALQVAQAQSQVSCRQNNQQFLNNLGKVEAGFRVLAAIFEPVFGL